MFIFFPPVVQILGGIAILVAGVAAHSAVTEVVGGLCLVLGGARWLRRGGSGARR